MNTHDRPLQIEELTREAYQAHAGILHEAEWQMLHRVIALRNGDHVAGPAYDESQGLDPFLPEWARRKLKNICRKTKRLNVQRTRNPQPTTDNPRAGGAE